jgi:MazG family protein
MNALRRVIARLRGPDGCPWDREQTPLSVIRFLIEEAYELVDAVAAGSAEHVCEELGDLLFHVLFLAQIYSETGEFDLDDVCRTITEKMERRHPHVFGSTQVADSAEVVRNWQRIKQEEKTNDRQPSILDAVPSGLPGMARAYAVSEHAARANFDWEDMPHVIEKLEEELAEFKAAVGRRDADEVSREFGDLLFTLVNVGRFSRVHPETALRISIQKFVNRFRKMEKIIADSGRRLEAVSQREKDAMWDRIKSNDDDLESESNP